MNVIYFVTDLQNSFDFISIETDNPHFLEQVLLNASNKSSCFSSISVIGIVILNSNDEQEKFYDIIVIFRIIGL